MNKKELYMIGNSHIDPVWFWTWEEGMQEVKSTYASALDRMNEFEEFIFSSTSTAFFEWIEALLPEMFEEIRQRVAEGRWELTGGWFLEPDCILPCGEAFVREGLYGQRYLQSRFGKTAKIGSNVDSFGHNPNLPQILKKSGMDHYVFMRPRLDTPVFTWESEDGSRVSAISLPAEYTTWFHDPTVKNVNMTLERTQGYDRMPCCYGVGNHGGGPTIENIRSIQALEYSFPDVHLKFSSYTEFLEDIKDWELPVLTGAFEKVNDGCYSNDGAFKQRNRLAETRLMEADTLMSMAHLMGCGWMRQTGQMEKLWKNVLFNQFHDTMGGTVIKSAREEAMMQLGLACAEAGTIRALALQNMANQMDTTGEGFPLLLFHTGGQDFDDLVEVELEWFCQSPLTLLDSAGGEIPYQRIHTDTKVRHSTLGGRRRFVFRAQIPSCGFAVYRTVKREPSLCYNNHMEIMNPEALVLENELICARFAAETGELVSLTDKTTGYNPLKKAAHIQVYLDQRDAWGGLQNRKFEKTGERFTFVSIHKVESGPIRQVIRVRSRLGATLLEQLYSLGAGEKELRVENRLTYNHKWTLLKAAYPLGRAHCHTEVETAYGTYTREIGAKDQAEYFMQRFVDVTDEAGAGLYIANDGKYAFNMDDGALQLTLCRSAIYAQGNCTPDWENETESYQYMDQGETTFSLVLRPHQERLPKAEMYRMAEKLHGAYACLADSAHRGAQKAENRSFAGVDQANVRLVLMKKCEDDEAVILRLLECEGQTTACRVRVGQKSYPVTIGKHEILTLKIRPEEACAQVVNLLEWKD
ncbi:MAG: alpha-mannosidase [Lachnospiraceae bacterium]|nr:alpha-mannosidase [Lachnospiraceae bacterium]